MPSASLKLNVLLWCCRRPVVMVGRPVFPYEPMVRVSLWLSVTAVAVLFGWGWQRRWIAGRRTDRPADGKATYWPATDRSSTRAS